MSKPDVRAQLGYSLVELLVGVTILLAALIVRSLRGRAEDNKGLFLTIAGPRMH